MSTHDWPFTQVLTDYRDDRVIDDDQRDLVVSIQARGLGLYSGAFLVASELAILDPDADITSVIWTIRSRDDAESQIGKSYEIQAADLPMMTALGGGFAVSASNGYPSMMQWGVCAECVGATGASNGVQARLTVYYNDASEPSEAA